MKPVVDMAQRWKEYLAKHTPTPEDLAFFKKRMTAKGAEPNRARGKSFAKSSQISALVERFHRICRRSRRRARRADQGRIGWCVTWMTTTYIYRAPNPVIDKRPGPSNARSQEKSMHADSMAHNQATTNVKGRDTLKPVDAVTPTQYVTYLDVNIIKLTPL